MERTTIETTRGRIVLTAAVLICGLCACSSSAPTPQLRDARKAYDDAAENAATKRVPQELRDARVALDQAERAHKDDPGSQREAQLAEVAEHKADLALAHGRLAEAQSDAAAAKAKARDEVAEAQRKANEEKAEAERKANQEKAEARSQAAEARRDLDKDKASDEARRDLDKDKKSDEAQREHAAVNVQREQAKRATPARERPAPVHAKPSTDRAAAEALQNLAQVANVKQEARGTVITLSGSLLFPNGKEDLSPIAQQNINRVADAVAQQPSESKLAVEGYTDNTGSKQQNERLSKKRAQAVADQLVERGIDKSRIEVFGYGESRPIASNDSEEGRALNRRVEIVIAPPGKSPIAMNESAQR